MPIYLYGGDSLYRTNMCKLHLTALFTHTHTNTHTDVVLFPGHGDWFLGGGNGKFNTRMKLAKTGLVEHLYTTEFPGKGDINASAWKVNDMKAYANVCTMVSPSL